MNGVSAGAAALAASLVLTAGAGAGAVGGGHAHAVRAVSASSRLSPAAVAPADTQLWLADLESELRSYWSAVLADRPTSYRGPQATVLYTDRIPTPCGKMPMQNAIYCDADRTVYLDGSWLGQLLAGPATRPVAAFVPAHEWGHELQDEFGRLNGGSSTRYLRALELNADCYAGVFFGSIEAPGGLEPEARAVHSFLAAAGDLRAARVPHGTGRQRIRWFDIGVTSASPAACDDVFRVEHALAGPPAE